jgi:hypothetical protein
METMATPVTNRHASLIAEQAQALFEAYKTEGLTFTKDGEEKPSNIDVTHRVLKVLLDKAIVRKKSEIQTNAITPDDLAAIVFPSTTNPTSHDWPADDDDSDQAEITRHVWRRIKTAVAKTVQTGRRGTVQKELAANQQTGELIVCATKIGTSQTRAVFLSDDKDMILLGLAMQRTTKLSALSADIADDFNYAIEQNPRLKKALNDKMETGLKAARDTARAKLALTSGEPENES